MAQTTESWGSRVGLILAMAGNAVGLGNFLRFPVQAVQNGGGTFIIPYLVSFLLMGIPLLWVEWAMGRFGGRYGDHSTPFILDNMTKRRFWKYFGVFGIFTNMGVMAYYTYIESWTLTYTIKSLKGDFLGLDLAQLDTFFNNYVDLGSGVNFPVWAILAFLVTLTINIYILSRGLSAGIETVAKIAMPLLILFGAFLAIMSWTTGSTGRCDDCSTFIGLNFLWEPDFTTLANPKIWLAAAGQIFFTLSVGMGTIHCYSSYLKQKDDIALNAMAAGSNKTPLALLCQFLRYISGTIVTTTGSAGRASQTSSAVTFDTVSTRIWSFLRKESRLIADCIFDRIAGFGSALTATNTRTAT